MKYSETTIYQRSLELVRIVRGVIARLPPGYAFLADQLRRAVSSIPLNFAEGAGKLTARDRRRYFISARGSAYEVAAALDVGLNFGVIADQPCSHGKEICDHLAAMLSKFR